MTVRGGRLKDQPAPLKILTFSRAISVIISLEPIEVREEAVYNKGTTYTEVDFSRQATFLRIKCQQLNIGHYLPRTLAFETNESNITRPVYRVSLLFA